jgi:hypothetical protein
MQNQRIVQRLKTLRFNIDDINHSYDNTLKDTFLEVGLEYHKQYPANDETYRLFNKEQELRSLYKDKLFSSIFNFTQTYYSIKEYLVKEFPQKKEIIEDFFSNEKIGLLTRKAICNDLKHDPKKDLKYEFGEVSKQTFTEPGQVVIKIEFRRTWFYSGIDSVEHCNVLYKELKRFIEVDFKL